VPAAERFRTQASLVLGETVSDPARALVWLCDRMEQWLDLAEVDEEAERLFVEGAGAFLGLVLMQHVPGARYAARSTVHRVRLGAHGWFDPFAAVDRALDARDVRRELSRQVATAEAAAASHGPTSRVLRHLLERIERERPELYVDDQFDLCLVLRVRDDPAERIELDLQRAVDSTRDQKIEAVHDVVQRMLSMLPGAAPALLDFADVRARLIPRLARTDKLGELDANMPLFRAPLTDELVVALLVEYEGRARYVKTRELEAWRCTGDAALDLALANLASHSERARIAREHTAYGPLWVARTGDGRDSARVLLASLHTHLRERVGERVLIGIPHRDTFFACAAGEPALADALRARVAHDAERAPHRLSARVFQLTSAGRLA